VAITRDDVQHVARLARLAFGDEDADAMVEQLSTILGHVPALSDLDQPAEPPTAHALDVANVTRADTARDSWPLDEVLAGAPATQHGAFRVPPA
jgi:aspartyl-tRNA(Asn)/glutamyl-tRNA(Gln) amidotransferase subunit C